MSKEQLLFLRRNRIKSIVIFLVQISIVFSFLVLWEILSNKGIINSFIFSSPSKVFGCIYSMVIDGSIYRHIYVTLYETIIAFLIGMFISISLSTILYLFNYVYKVFDPFLTMVNSLPKVALGPMIIIIFGANINSIIVVAILINVIVSTLMILDGFFKTDLIKIKLLKSFRASKFQILRYLVFPNSYRTIISSFKLSISMSLIGVITGEFLVSKEGLGYLIIYGTQVFNLDLVISGIVLLIIISFILYKIVLFIEKVLIK